MDFKTYLKQKKLIKTTVKMYHYQAMYFISILDKDNTEVENCTEKEFILCLSHL